MRAEIIVQIIGAPIACKEGVKDTWRETAAWAGGQLRQRFGEAVQVQYFDLFDPTCPPIPTGAQLPLVLVNGEVISSGGKISIPSIRKYLEASGVKLIQTS
jgi:disulfide oxidoreductase YuzD